ncbi:protein of unknown function [Trichlorobacter ammonificans]|uniref:Uncharacterized protein n=1 Tax=Trichlorobacter ammonificans TaxID=2916410 RepID=A0ABM9D636_9BACT|nr:protein of unknown function [Trichlorobacter ammonificans]
MRIDEQFGDEVVILVANGLGDGLFYTHVGRFAFDHRQRDTVDKQDDIRPGGFVTAGACHVEFSGDMKGIALPVAPVDVVQVEALGVPFDSLFQRGAEGNQVVYCFVGFEQSVVFDVLQFLDGGLDVLFAEQEFAAFVVDAVESFQLVAQDTLKKHIAGFALALFHDLLWGEIFIAQVDQELQGWDLGKVFFVEAENGHGFLLAWLRVR